MKLFKLIEVDLDKERARIRKKGTYNLRQQRALFKLCDLFGAGEWQACLDHVNNKKAFPYNKRGEYSELEHISICISDILHNLKYDNFYTQSQLLTQAEDLINSRKP